MHGGVGCRSLSRSTPVIAFAGNDYFCDDMAKLTDLKKLVDEARARQPATEAPRVALSRASTGALSINKPVLASKRAIAAGKHSDHDLDLAHAFADVRRLPPS